MSKYDSTSPQDQGGGEADRVDTSKRRLLGNLAYVPPALVALGTLGPRVAKGQTPPPNPSDTPDLESEPEQPSVWE